MQNMNTGRRIAALMLALGMLTGYAVPSVTHAQVRPVFITASSDALRIEVTFERPAQVLDLPLRWPTADGYALPYAAWPIAMSSVEDAEAVAAEIEELELDFVGADALALPVHSVEVEAPPLPATWPMHVAYVGIMRGVPLARVLLFPVRPAPGGWSWVRRLRARVRMSPQIVAASHAKPFDSDPLLRVIATQVANPEWIGDPSSAIVPLHADSSVTIRALIDVERPAWVALTRAGLEAAGVPLVSPQRLRLRQGAHEVRMLWEGDADEEFEPDERLLFYAQPRFSRYAAHDTWILEEANAPAARIGARNAAPGAAPSGVLYGSFTFEQNALYTPECGCRPPMHRDGDRWAWASLQQGQSWSLPFTLPISAAQPASLTIWLLGYTDPPQNPDHRAQIWLNGALLGEALWDGRQAITATFAATVMASNVLSVALPGLSGVTVEGTWIDGFSVTTAVNATGAVGRPLRGENDARTYALNVAPLYLLDVTTPTQPVLLQGWEHTSAGARFADPSTGLPRRYAVFTQTDLPQRIRPPAAINPAAGNLHVIAPDELWPALGELVARRQAQGFAVVTQTVQALYDHHGEGRVDPWAIRAYLAARYHADAVRPAYVLLVGDGTFDPKRYRDTSPPTLLPAFLADVDPRLGETAADNRFVTVDGNDALPDMAIGRWPVNTLAEAQAVVSKALAYESALLTAGDRRMLLVSDNADSGGNFPAKALSLAGAAPATYITTTALMTTAAAFTATRTTALAFWNYARLIAYLGHSSPRQWAAERLFHLNDVAGLPPRDALPVVIGLTCYTGRFHELQDALDETLVRAPGRGTVAAWGATGLTISTGHDSLGRGFTQTWLGGGRLGDAALAGKLLLAGGGLYLDLLDTFVLLGDPSLAAGSRWATHAVWLPTARRP